MSDFHKTTLTFIVWGEIVKINVDRDLSFSEVRKRVLFRDSVGTGGRDPAIFEIRCARGCRIDPETRLMDEFKRGSSRQFFLSLPVGHSA